MSDQGTVYAAFIEAELPAERDRRKAHEERGAALVTTSTAFAGLIVVVAALILGAGYKLNGGTLTGALVICVLVLFVTAGIFGLLANRLMSYDVVTDETFKQMLNERWPDTEISARNETSQFRVATVTSLRKTNDTRASWIERGQWAQLVAVVVLLIATLIEVGQRVF